MDKKVRINIISDESENDLSCETTTFTVGNEFQNDAVIKALKRGLDSLGEGGTYGIRDNFTQEQRTIEGSNKVDEPITCFNLFELLQRGRQIRCQAIKEEEDYPLEVNIKFHSTSHNKVSVALHGLQFGPLEEESVNGVALRAINRLWDVLREIDIDILGKDPESLMSRHLPPEFRNA